MEFEKRLVSKGKAPGNDQQPKQEDISYTMAAELFSNLRRIRLAAKPKVTMYEIQAHTGILPYRISHYERGMSRWGKPPKETILVATARKLIGWSIPIEMKKEQYERSVRDLQDYAREYQSEYIEYRRSR